MRIYDGQYVTDSTWLTGRNGTDGTWEEGEGAEPRINKKMASVGLELF